MGELRRVVPHRAIYVVATFGSIFVLAAPCVLTVRLLGRGVLVPLAIPTLIVVVPWLVTLYAVQALASRIAVLEDRHALDAIRKARLFLHGRMRHAFKLMVAAFVGTLFVGAVGVAAIGPVVLLLVAAAKPCRHGAGRGDGMLTLVPAVFVLVAFVGTVRSPRGRSAISSKPSADRERRAPFPIARCPRCRPGRSRAISKALSSRFGGDAEPLDEPSIQRLVAQARTGDRIATQRLYRQHVERVFRSFAACFDRTLRRRTLRRMRCSRC